MPRGRPRKIPHNLPAHIDYARVPAGIYWNPNGRGRWYVRDPDDEGGTKARVVAGPTAKLSDLHAIAEARAGVDRTLLRSMLQAFHASPEFRVLGKATRDDYGYCFDRIAEQTTHQGGSVLDLETRKIPRPLIQRLIDRIAQGRKRDKAGALVPTPSTAAHVLRYLRVAFRWGANRGWADENPALGVEAPKERKQRRLPAHATYADVAAFARAHGTTQRGVKGSVAPYLADVAELAYLCRLRGIEVVVDLNDADVTPEGLVCRRRKGSLTTVTRWDPRLRAAVEALQARRAQIWADRRRPVPMRPEARPLVVSVYGHPLTKRAFNSAWQRMVRAAIAQGVIPEGARFGLHDLKRRGITDTAGTRSEKQQASGHREESMMDVYDFDVAVVDSAAASLVKKPPKA
jgi:site-specific recombinase XerC